MTDYWFFALLILGTHILLEKYPFIEKVPLSIFVVIILLIISLSLLATIIFNLNSIFVEAVTIVLVVSFQNKLGHKAEKQ